MIMCAREEDVYVWRKWDVESGIEDANAIFEIAHWRFVKTTGPGFTHEAGAYDPFPGVLDQNVESGILLTPRGARTPRAKLIQSARLVRYVRPASDMSIHRPGVPAKCGAYCSGENYRTCYVRCNKKTIVFCRRNRKDLVNRDAGTGFCPDFEKLAIIGEIAKEKQCQTALLTPPGGWLCSGSFAQPVQRPWHSDIKAFLTFWPVGTAAV
jgi:hypothetical protein